MGPVAQADQVSVEEKREAYLEAQRNFGRQLRKRSIGAPSDKKWLISDLVTFGSPLTHAEFLLSRNEKGLKTRMEEREYPKSPPIFENVDGAGFSDAKQAKLPIEPKQPELMCYKIPSETDLWRLHHAAPFAAVRWTNIYDPALLVFSGTSFPALLRHILATALSMSICERCVDNRAALLTPAIGRCRNPISRNRANVLWNCARRSIWREIAPLHSKPKRKVTTRALCARRREIHYQSGSASNFVYSNGTSK